MKILFSCMLCILTIICHADNPISGNTSVTPNSIETYTVNWDSWGSVFENYANVTWNVTNGIVLSSDKHTVTIQWDDVPPWLNEVGSIEVAEDLGGGQGNLGVDITNFVEGVLATCNGILGPPAINMSFGSGNNPGPPLPNGATNYDYKPYCAVNSGEYSLTNTLTGCRIQWLNIPIDHTPGDINGYMLIIDGDNRRGEIFRATVSGLTQAFEYEFSAWVANLADDVSFQKPKIHFEIRDNNNNLISESGSFKIDFDSQDPWKRISFMFPIPAGMTSLQIVLVNEHNSPQGNDFVVDDISFAPCYTLILASFANNTVIHKAYICNNGTVNLFSFWPTTSIPFSNPGFKWQRSINNGTTWTDISGATGMNFTQVENNPGIYNYRIISYEISNPTQFVISNTITYYVQQMVVDPKTFYVLACENAAKQLTPTYRLQYTDWDPAALSYTFNWSPGSYLSSTQIANPTITLPPLPPPTPPNPPTSANYFYTLTVQNTNFSCTGSNVQTVTHTNPRKVAIFTAFTPNNDGLNDFFFPKYIWDYHQFGAEFSIYNRWGQLIHYRNQGATQQDWHWDGKIGGVLQPSGVFVFLLKIPGCPANFVTPLPPGVTYQNGGLRGTFTLIR